MNITNLTSNDIQFRNLGFTLLALESKNLRDVDNFYTLSSNLDELVQPMLDGLVQFEEDSSIYSTIASIANYLNTGITKINIDQDETADALDVNIINNENSFTSDDYYYFRKELKLLPGQKYIIEFKGYLKEAFIDLKSGTINVDVNNMGEIHLKDYTHFEFNMDYKLKDPLIYITCDKISTFEIFVEGIYEDNIKSKLQFLEELNAIQPEVDVPVLEEVNELLFNCDFTNVDLLDDNIFIDTVRNRIGEIENLDSSFSTDTIFKNGMYVNFGEVLNINQDKDYTFSIWFKFIEPDGYIHTRKQRLLYNETEYELYLKDKKLYFKGGDAKVKVLTDNEYFETDRYFNVILTFTNKSWNIFINGEYIASIDSKIKSKLSDFKIGSSSCPLEDVLVEKVKVYNYAFSQSMVNYLINNQNPQIEDDVANDYESGTRLNFYDCSSVTVVPSSNYAFTVLEKKYSNQDYYINSLENTNITLPSTGLPTVDNYITIIEGYIYLPESGTYMFGIDGDNAVEFIIDDESIVSWYGDHTNIGNLTTHTSEKFLPVGYHKFKFRHFEKLNGATINIGWVLPGYNLDITKMEQIPTENFFRKKLLLAPGLFGMSNCIPYNCTFDANFDSIKAPILSDDSGLFDYFSINNLKTIRFQDMIGFAHQKIFTFNYWINTNSGYNYIYSIGNKAYTDYLSGYSYKEDIKNSFEAVRKTSEHNLNLGGWTMITVTGNGTTLTFYKDGVEVETTEQKFNSYYEYSPMYVNFGTTSNGTPPSYMRYTNFKLSEWFYDEKLYTKHDLLGLYTKQGEKYGL